MPRFSSALSRDYLYVITFSFIPLSATGSPKMKESLYKTLFGTQVSSKGSHFRHSQSGASIQVTWHEWTNQRLSWKWWQFDLQLSDAFWDLWDKKCDVIILKSSADWSKRFRASSSRKMERNKRDSIRSLDGKRLLRRLILPRKKGLKKSIGKPLQTHLCFTSHLAFVSVHPPGTSLDSACHFKSFSCSWILTHFCSSGAVSFLSTSVTSYN